jgi:uncharacterized protein (TIGR00730 family)
MRAISVFCGSKDGVRPEYTEAAARLGHLLAEQQIRLVYGGSNVGLMRTIADSCMAAGGEVIGVMPQTMVAKEIANRNVSQLHIVGTMHERKAMMADLADGFIAMPGGFGTFDELFEIVTWRQIGLHSKPIGLLNTSGFFEPLLRLADHAIAEGFVRPADAAVLFSESTPDALLERLTNSAIATRRAAVAANATWTEAK